jgi:choline dehydrogenase
VESDEEILDWVRRDAETALHPTCTTKLGTGADAVLDPGSMRVHGCRACAWSTRALSRTCRTANTYAPTMMVAEKAADLILGNTPLPVATAPFFRLRDGSPLYPPGIHEIRAERVHDGDGDRRQADRGADAGDGSGESRWSSSPARA